MGQRRTAKRGSLLGRHQRHVRLKTIGADAVDIYNDEAVEAAPIMSGLGLLGKLKQRRGDAKLEYEWGSSKVLQTLDLDKLPRAALRSHLDARDLETGGTKRAMVKRLQADLEGETTASHGLHGAARVRVPHQQGY